MRTTLKRGFGRAAEGNGNGRAVLPPAAATPITLYRQQPPPRRTGLQILRRVVFWGFAVVLMVAVAMAGGIYLYFHEAVASVSAHSEDVKRAQARLDAVPPPDKAAIALVLGYDRRFGKETSGSLSDTLMLLRADPSTDSISMLSFPRDLSVEIHCPGRGVWHSKINQAYSACGAEGSLETIRALTDLPINYLITVNFRGFKRIVNTLGGVWVDVDRRYFNDNSGLGSGFTYAKINLKPGYQRLTGGAALDYVRFRHTDSDFYRVARQQAFVQAMKAQFRKKFSVDKIPPLIGAIRNNVEIGRGGNEPLSFNLIRRYVEFAHGLPPGHFFQARIDNVTGYSELYADSSNLEAAVQEFVNPDVEAPKVATAVALGRKIKTAAPKPAETSVVVLNGNGVIGSAGNARYLLGRQGYRTIDPPPDATGNAPSFDYFHTSIYFDPAQPRSKAAANQVAKLLAPADVAKVPKIVRPLSNGAMLTVVVGKTFDNQLTSELAPSREITRQAPRVAINPDLSEPLLREVKDKVPFPLMVPTAVDPGSIPDPEMAVRAYRISGGSKAVRLTFRTGGRQYWGIQMTNWEDAPVLDEKNTRQVVAGRAFDFYYQGSKLHMIVLKRGKASYWVVNTLLNALSNETMIAIAKGLRPLDPPKRARVAATKKAAAKAKTANE